MTVPTSSRRWPRDLACRISADTTSLSGATSRPSVPTTICSRRSLISRDPSSLPCWRAATRLVSRLSPVEFSLALVRFGRLSTRCAPWIPAIGTYYRLLLAEALNSAGQSSTAISALDDGLAVAARTGDQWLSAELLRRKAELLLTGSNRISARLSNSSDERSTSRAGNPPSCSSSERRRASRACGPGRAGVRRRATCWRLSTTGSPKASDRSICRRGARSWPNWAAKAIALVDRT